LVPFKVHETSVQAFGYRKNKLEDKRVNSRKGGINIQ
jgi:hypothetical protein